MANDSRRGKSQRTSGFHHTVSHELKTPLTSATEFISILLEGLAGPLAAEQREYLALAKQSCDQMKRCLDDLLEATRAETGKLQVKLVRTSLDRVLDAAMASMIPFIGANGVRLIRGLSQAGQVVMDENRIMQVLLNLLSNARRYTPSGGEVRIDVRHDSNETGFLFVSVSNTGPPVKAEDLERIFERGYQGSQNDHSGEAGLGLGLYISRQIVALHGGKIWAENVPSLGPKFTFSLKKASQPSKAALQTVFAKSMVS